MNQAETLEKIDLHMHTVVSDGTDTPEEIIEKVRQAGIELFSVTDHDAVAGAARIQKLLETSGCETGDASSEKTEQGSAQSLKEPRASGTDRNLIFINGVEFSCRDTGGKYHILGYGYDAASEAITALAGRAHEMRIEKVNARLEFLRSEFNIVFNDKELEALFHHSNPGKPHIANLMIKKGYASSIREAMQNYLNKKKFPNAYLKPEQAIEAILKSGGIPVLAHPSFGDGDQLITGQKMDQRLRHLIRFGLQGVEGYYSGFSPKLIEENLSFAERYDLYVTAGSDYHGTNKLAQLGDTNLSSVSQGNERVRKFLRMVCGNRKTV